MKTEYHVLSLGAGVQSTTVYLLALEGWPGHPVVNQPRFDAAIFADTQDEPAAIYRHLEWLRSLGGPPIITRSVGRLGDDIIKGRNSQGHPFMAASIPAYTGVGGRAFGKGRRQCTREYKIRVIEQGVRRDVLGLAPRRSVPRGTVVYQYIGISTDEARRSINIKARFAKGERKGIPMFPLLEMGWSRADCERFLRQRVPHEVRRSACVFCPLKSDREWLWLKENDAASWRRAVEVDAALRARPAAVTRTMRLPIFLHRSAKPLDVAPLKGEGQGEFPYFAQECEGACGV